MGKRSCILVSLVFMLLFCLQCVSFAAPVKKAVTVVYVSQADGYPMVDDAWYSDVAEAVNKKLSSFGISADDVKVP